MLEFRAFVFVVFSRRPKLLRLLLFIVASLKDIPARTHNMGPTWYNRGIHGHMWAWDAHIGPICSPY